ncbi:hypothetical protein M3Y94_00942500 [Aphelenchoides besseyi]|nr:hypothetical protein M3Y94_00942500 [Aphelenchoides besseyi]KAI6224884.1 Elongin-C [Aphelenchoides besseyi]
MSDQTGTTATEPTESEPTETEPTAPVVCERFTICGSKSTHIKLISEDGHEFYVRRNYAVERSPTIKNMLYGFMTYDEDEVAEITFKEIASTILELTCVYYGYFACNDENW